MTRATIVAVIIVPPFSCGDVLRGYNGRNACLPPACPAYRQAGGRQGRQKQCKYPTYGRQAK